MNPNRKFWPVDTRIFKGVAQVCQACKGIGLRQGDVFISTDSKEPGQFCKVCVSETECPACGKALNSFSEANSDTYLCSTCHVDPKLSFLKGW